MTTKNRRAVGTLGFVAIIAVLAVSMIAMNFTSPVLADHVPAKSGYVGGSELSVNAGAGESVLIDEIYFKSNKGGNVLFDLTAECATMTHIKGKGKMDSFDGASVGAKVWFEWLPAGLPDIDDNWDVIPIGPDGYDEAADPEDLGKWNFCEQVFAIKTNLNDLIFTCEDAWEAFGDSEDQDVLDRLEAACPTVDGAGEVIIDPTKLVFECTISGLTSSDDCAQSVELFLKTAGTHPATALLMDVPTGIHEARVMTSITIDPQSGLEPTECDEQTGICDIKTALMIGKRLLIVEDIHLANDAGL